MYYSITRYTEPSTVANSNHGVWVFPEHYWDFLQKKLDEGITWGSAVLTYLTLGWLRNERGVTVPQEYWEALCGWINARLPTASKSASELLDRSALGKNECLLKEQPAGEDFDPMLHFPDRTDILATAMYNYRNLGASKQVLREPDA